MSIIDKTANFLGFERKIKQPQAYVPSKTDRAARQISTNGIRWDGTSYDQPYAWPDFTHRIRDILQKGFGSEVRRNAAGEFHGIAGAEMVMGQDGRFHRKGDVRPERNSAGRANDDWL